MAIMVTSQLKIYGGFDKDVTTLDIDDAGDKGCFGSYMKLYNLILLSMILQLE